MRRRPTVGLQATTDNIKTLMKLLQTSRAAMLLESLALVLRVLQASFGGVDILDLLSTDNIFAYLGWRRTISLTHVTLASVPGIPSLLGKALAPSQEFSIR